MSTELLEELVEAGVHYGHQRRKWNPKMKPFLLEQKNNIYIINLFETVKQIEAAAAYLAELAANGKRILFVGCKRQAQVAPAGPPPTTNGRPPPAGRCRWRRDRRRPPRCSARP